jgi:hypothetical protein
MYEGVSYPNVFIIYKISNSCFHSIVRSISSFIAAQNDAISLGIGPAFDEVRSSMMESIWQLSDVSMPSEWLKKCM